MAEPIVDINALATLARLAITDQEKESLQKEIPNILAFVDTIQKIDTSLVEKTPQLHNVFRADTDARPTGEYTASLLEAAPAASNNRVVVRQVVSRDKKN